MHAVPAAFTVQVSKKWKQLKKLKVPLKSAHIIVLHVFLLAESNLHDGL